MILSLLGVLTACTGAIGNNVVSDCPVTSPSQQSKSPPIDIEHDGKFWYGTPALWTILPENGIWQGLPQDEDGYVQKTVFWREGYVALDEPQPALTVSGSRLDAPAPTFSFSDATHGWDNTSDFMLMGISIPTEGCWELEAAYEDAKLNFVVLVKP
jgi:hypothetical protein